MTEMRDHRQHEYEHTVADQPHAKERGAAHATFGIIEKAVDAGVGQLRRDLLDEEKVGVKPAYVIEP